LDSRLDLGAILFRNKRFASSGKKCQHRLQEEIRPSILIGDFRFKSIRYFKVFIAISSPIFIFEFLIYFFQSRLQILLEYVEQLPKDLPVQEKRNIRRQICSELDDIDLKMRTLHQDIMRESLRRPGNSRFTL